MTRTTSLHESNVAEVPGANTIDARPMLRRSTDSLWERTEHLTRQVARMVEAQCAASRIGALVLQSDHYVHPAWVKFECWMPRADDSLTARSTMTVTLTAVPCHHFEVIYKVEWERHGRKHSIDHLHTFGEAEIAAMISYLCGDPDGLVTGLLPGSAARSWLRRVQLRQAWWQFWKPRNKIVLVRRDRLQLASLAALVLGAVLAFTGSGPSSPSLMATADAPGIQYPSTSPLPSDVARAAYRAAQETTNASSRLEKDRPATGSLGEEDQRRANDAPYDTWRYFAAAGEVFAVVMESSAFDSVLTIGVMENGSFTELQENDDWAGGPHARLEINGAEAREYVILASSYRAGTGGPYSLRVESVAPASASPPVSDSDTTLLATSSTQNAAPFYSGMLMLVVGAVGLLASARAPRLVRSAGKPMAEPRILYSLDSWQTVVFGAGDDAQLVRARLVAIFDNLGQTRFAYGSERVWYWGLDGKIEREQLVLRYGRALVFCQIHQYGSDLYIGWNAQMNLGTWQERSLASGVDVETGERVRLMTVEHAIQPTNDYDLTDLNTLAEWTHAQVTTMLKTYLKEKEIDQEIDFAIIRGQREGLKKREEKDNQGRRLQRKA